MGLIWKLCALATTLGLFRLALRYEHLSLYGVCVLHAADQYSVNSINDALQHTRPRNDSFQRT